MDTPNEFWVGPASSGNHWVVGPLGELDELVDRTNPGTRKISVGIDLDPLGGMSQNQADTVRALLCELVEDGDLDSRPADGIQYPTGSDGIDNNHLVYMRCFVDELEVGWLEGVDLGVSTGFSWRDGSPPQASPEPLPPEPVEEEEVVEELVVEEEADGDVDGDEDADG